MSDWPLRSLEKVILLPSGRPGGKPVRRRITGELAKPGAIGVDEVDVEGLTAKALERDLGSLRRPGGKGVPPWLVRYLTHVGAIGVHHVDVDIVTLVASEGDSLAILVAVEGGAPLHLLAASAEGEKRRRENQEHGHDLRLRRGLAFHRPNASVRTSSGSGSSVDSLQPP